MDDKAIIIKARLKKSGMAVLRVKGRCMEPLLFENEIVKVVVAEEIDVGDICLICVPYTNPMISRGELLIHRVVKKEKELYLTKGDCSGKYEKISREDIVGKMFTDTANSKLKNKIIAFLSLRQICREKNEKKLEQKGTFCSEKSKPVRRKFFMRIVRSFNGF